MVSEEYRGARQWSRDKQAVFTVVWISFLTAAIGTMVFFALFDPVDLSGIFDEDLEIGRDAGYAAGFFFFWTCAHCVRASRHSSSAPHRSGDAKHR